MKPVILNSNQEPVKNSSEIAALIIAATNGQIEEILIEEKDDQKAEFRLATDALNYHRVEWRLREELGKEIDAGLLEKVKAKICAKRRYDPEEFDAALIATRDRPRLPYGWTAMDLAVRRLESKPIRLLNEDLEGSRYAKGILGLAIHLQETQKDEVILLPVEQVREILGAKKVVIAGTITKLVDMGLLEMTKATYNTGSAREFRFKGIEGNDYVFERIAEKVVVEANLHAPALQGSEPVLKETELREHAKKLLLAAANDKNGKFYYDRTMHGIHIQVGNKQMCPSQEPSDQAR